MNNKEAIAILSKCQLYLARNCGKIDMYNAISLAIKALNSIEQIKFNVYALNELINEIEK